MALACSYLLCDAPTALGLWAYDDDDDDDCSGHRGGRNARAFDLAIDRSRVEMPS